MIREPKVNGVSYTNKETDYCPKKFNRFLGEVLADPILNSR